MNNKLVPMILFYLSDGEKPRHKVTNKIKNYSKKMQSDAISYLLKEKLVCIREDRNPSKLGRTPCYIKLSEKGLEVSLEISQKPRHNSIWNI
jgi:hypothetical protein